MLRFSPDIDLGRVGAFFVLINTDYCFARLLPHHPLTLFDLIAKPLGFAYAIEFPHACGDTTLSWILRWIELDVIFLLENPDVSSFDCAVDDYLPVLQFRY